MYIWGRDTELFERPVLLYTGCARSLFLIETILYAKSLGFKVFFDEIKTL